MGSFRELTIIEQGDWKHQLRSKDSMPYILTSLDVCGPTPHATPTKNGCVHEDGKRHEYGSSWAEGDGDEERGKEDPEPDYYELGDGYNPERWALTTKDRHHGSVENYQVHGTYVYSQLQDLAAKIVLCVFLAVLIQCVWVQRSESRKGANCHHCPLCDVSGI
ncbi:hypothetical protein P3342_000179 [Pyrenophora teres f. teres]|nr:hypothetical protein PTNB85_04760 [Pyrenophora teres f. teres]KAE8862251.1 hypothetical protein PTNB29_04813 [Pyrenophora teres f. teres]KAK1917466.1 hypothetical protein P3342_000179 [Pyrenophora teres f. teres]CAA9956543.1 hypothetical protein PTMSG1_00151 [Pyrenophora teres f. maculata]